MILVFILSGSSLLGQNWRRNDTRPKITPIGADGLKVLLNGGDVFREETQYLKSNYGPM